MRLLLLLLLELLEAACRLSEYFGSRTAEPCGNSKVSVSLLFPQGSAVFIVKTADPCGNSSDN